MSVAHGRYNKTTCRHKKESLEGKRRKLGWKADLFPFGCQYIYSRRYWGNPRIYIRRLFSSLSTALVGWEEWKHLRHCDMSGPATSRTRALCEREKTIRNRERNNDRLRFFLEVAITLPSIHSFVQLSKIESYIQNTTRSPFCECEPHGPSSEDWFPTITIHFFRFPSIFLVFIIICSFIFLKEHEYNLAFQIDK